MRPLLFVSLALLCFNAMAASHTQEPQCNYNGNQLEMNICAINDYKVVDKALNEKYKKIMFSLKPDEQKILRKHQRAWLKKRDIQCKEQAEST